MKIQRKNKKGNGEWETSTDDHFEHQGRFSWGASFKQLPFF